MSKFHKIGPA